MKKFILTIIFGGYIFYCLIHPQPDWHLIDSVNLIFHEAGHTIFSFFGEFIHILSGSAFQIALPAGLAYYFFRRWDFHSASLVSAWAGYSMINVSIYIKDAIVMQLELLGGDSSGHDWHNLLSITGLLDHTYQIASLVSGLGYTIALVALLLAINYSFKKPLWNHNN